MHFFYLDEAGCNGRDLENKEQPIFVSGSLIVSDAKWNSTNQAFNQIISDYFNGEIPENFELHSEQLFSPDGDGPFEGHNRERRNKLANNLLDLIEGSSHHTAYYAVDKTSLNSELPTDFRVKDYLDLSAPYLISFDYLLSVFEWYTKDRLGSSARAMIILDEKDEFEEEIRSLVRHRKYNVPNVRRLKWLVEFSYPISSHKNPMVQLSDLISFLTKKYLEIENGYREYYSQEVKNIYRDYYAKIEDRLVRKRILQYDSRIRAEEYYEFLNRIKSIPDRNWKNKEYV